MLEPGTRAAVSALITEAKDQGHDVRVMETYRSQCRQAYVYLHGFSQLKKVGCHGYGVGVDLGVFIDGKYEEDGDPHYKFLLPLARKHGLISGQDWGRPDLKHSFIDWGHVQRIPVFRQAQLFSGEWFPSEVYDPYKDLKAHSNIEIATMPAPLERWRAQSKLTA